MSLFDLIAEQRIAEALARGEFDHLEGAGRPLDLEQDALIPEDLRMAYRILKNAGYVPPEVEAMREASTLRDLIAHLDDEGERSKALGKLRLLELRYANARRGELSLDACYYERIVEKLA